MDNDTQGKVRLELLQAALDQIDQGFTVFDAGLEMIGWNERFFELLEFPKNLAKTGTHFSEFMRYNALRGEYGDGDVELLVKERVERAARFTPHEFERRRPTGEVLLVRGTPLPGGGFVTTYTDVTSDRERQAQLESAVAIRTKALSESEAKLRLITDTVPALIAYIDRSRIYRFANRRYAEFFGYEVTTIVGQRVEDVFDVDVMQTVAPHIDTALNGETTSYEYRRQESSGTVSDISSTLVPDLGDDGLVHGCFVMALDVTERKVQDAALRQAQKMEAVGRLTGGLAHDFNNLLTVIIGNLRGLEERSRADPMVAEYIRPAIHAAERGSELTNRLLSFAREKPLKAERVDVESIIADISRLLRRSLPSSIEVTTCIKGLPPAVHVDANQLENALLNLALNARDAIDGAGRITFYVFEEEASPGPPDTLDAAPKRVCIEVRDTGCGIKEEVLPHLFDPFFTTKEFGTGSGLGLSMVYGFAQQSDGEIRVSSAPGEGTRVCLFLPASTAPPPPPKPKETVTNDRRTVASASRGGLVLLVEDDEAVRKVVRGQFLSLGYKVLEAENSADALTLVDATEEIRFLISDIVMPGQMDGLALADEAKFRAPGLGIALITGFSSDLADGEVKDCPFPVLSKPFTTEALRSVMDRLETGS
ncbi:PAS domain-containing protein [Rhodospirillaceae bacterium KN72]|uniref:histidine kinase n=1 Tax=Pacificispira spongiicola TaxID=2729598 RepID=A0A7Y0DYQ1_9PROT|nr:PAS-domain containing protein [Pacificispira spongiicola]NMM43938.1 PAS domain-containing protein [Pacificispira spongiicola]